MDKALLDSDILSELLRGKNANVLQNGVAYRRAFGHYTTSAITVFEIISGFRQMKLERRIDEFQQALLTQEVLSLDAEAAATASLMYGDLVRTGQTIGHADPMIDAIAIRYDLTLVTGNTQHFKRIVDLGYPLRLDDWRS
jgi:tRNA(fMet)-specific endonuclease VapC